MIDYPSSSFLARSLRALRDGAELTISVRPGWRSTLLARELPSLPSSAQEASSSKRNGKKPPSLKMSLLMMPISIVHHFALSGDFVMSFRNEKEMVITYSRSGKPK